LQFSDLLFAIFQWSQMYPRIVDWKCRTNVRKIYWLARCSF